jgi:c-di-GMP-binding flagellar brake protein YcgR
MGLELRVMDVAIGGCALLLPADIPAIPAGVGLNAVRIILDADTEFRTSLMVHHITVIQPDAAGVRLGCSFGKTPPDATRALQRYIDTTQKRRRMLAMD